MVGKEYDEVDLRDARSAGFCIGAIAGSAATFFLCLFLGLYFSN